MIAPQLSVRHLCVFDFSSLLRLSCSLFLHCCLPVGFPSVLPVRTHARRHTHIYLVSVGVVCKLKHIYLHVRKYTHTHTHTQFSYTRLVVYNKRVYVLPSETLWVVEKFLRTQRMNLIKWKQEAHTKAYQGV